MIKIRKIKKSDIGPACKLIINAYKKYIHTKSAGEMLRIYQQCYDPKTNSRPKTEKYFAQAPISYVALDGKKIVGIVRGRLTRLISLYVDGHYHHRGIATELTVFFENEAKKLGSKKIKVRASLYAEPFYAKMGYKKTSGKRFLYGLKYQPMKKILFLLLSVSFLASGCAAPRNVIVSRAEKIPAAAAKMTPKTDSYPPILHSAEYQTPRPLPAPVSTAGAEDSAFILPDGQTLYFFFTPDVAVPANQQLFDGVTGIWVSKKSAGTWSEPERVWLQKPGKLALDGCEFVAGDLMWFCSAREGYDGIKLFTADFKNGQWQNWRYAGDKLMNDYQVGEMHLSAGGTELYFHSPRPGGQGGLDIWLSVKAGGEWQEPQNLSALNTAGDEGWPFLSQDGLQLWFTRTYQGSPAIFRAQKINGAWGQPELIISQFAGEPTLDNDGNLYFTHHFYQNNKMIEADIYFAKKLK